MNPEPCLLPLSEQAKENRSELLEHLIVSLNHELGHTLMKLHNGLRSLCAPLSDTTLLVPSLLQTTEVMETTLQAHLELLHLPSHPVRCTPYGLIAAAARCIQLELYLHDIGFEVEGDTDYHLFLPPGATVLTLASVLCSSVKACKYSKVRQISINVEIRDQDIRFLIKHTGSYDVAEGEDTYLRQFSGSFNSTKSRDIVITVLPEMEGVELVFSLLC